MLTGRLPTTGLQIGTKLCGRPTTRPACSKSSSSSAESIIEPWPVQENEPPNVARMSIDDFYEQVYRPTSPTPKEGSRPTIKQLPRGSACAVVLGGAMADSSNADVLCASLPRLGLLGHCFESAYPAYRAFVDGHSLCSARPPACACVP
eukprot:scaffold212804_cov19-Tisochrysis_lutea.AAC.1